MSQRVSLSQLCSCCIMLAFPVVAAPAAATELAPCQPLQLDASATPHQTTAVTTPADVSMQLQRGQLEPQIRQLLREHLAIKVLDWQASPHHQWPTEHTVRAGSWAEVLRRVLQPYHLQLVMHPNHSAVVRYRDAAAL